MRHAQSPLDKLKNQWKEQDDNSRLHAIATEVVNGETVRLCQLNDDEVGKVNSIIRSRKIAYQQVIMWS